MLRNVGMNGCTCKWCGKKITKDIAIKYDNTCCNSHRQNQAFTDGFKPRGLFA